MKDATLRLLKSDKPSQRSVAIDRMRLEATSADLRILRAAMQAETVPILRRQLSQVVRSLSRPPAPPGATVPVEGVAADRGRFEEDVVHWMRHELEPGIGWLMLAASDEIEGFLTSETHAAIEGLNKRLDSVEALVRASAPPRYELVSLAEVVQEAARISSAPRSRLDFDLVGGAADNITTDANLLRLIASNAIRNAVDAVLEVPGDAARIRITSGVTRSTFWLKVSNHFVGSDFSLDDVSGTGVSAKIGHQGQGFGIMRIVAARLEYDLSMQAEAGLAVFTLRGGRENG